MRKHLFYPFNYFTCEIVCIYPDGSLHNLILPKLINFFLHRLPVFYAYLRKLSTGLQSLLSLYDKPKIMMKPAIAFLLSFSFLVSIHSNAQKPPFWDDIQNFKKQDSIHPPQQQGNSLPSSTKVSKWNSSASLKYF